MDAHEMIRRIEDLLETISEKELENELGSSYSSFIKDLAQVRQIE